MNLFRNTIFTAAFCVFAALTLTLNAQDHYSNPIIPGFYPDPSVCRVGDDYFIVNSSFHFFPGVPLWHSKDLAHWEQIGNVLSRPSQLNLDRAMRWGGIYATTIRFDESDGTYYMITTNTTNGGNFFVWTKDPWGEWSDPVWLEQGGIDPSFYFEDGTCYMVSNPDGCIYLCTIDPKTGKTLTPSKALWTGTGGRYPEGPHIYKKDGWYYLLISEGGTEYGHMITIARSRNIEGPYSSNPANPIMTHRDQSGQSSPIQCTGHADFVQATDGSWWMVCLGVRPQAGNNHLLGRETFLAPVRWDEGAWPVVNGNGTIALEMHANLPAWQPFEEEQAKLVFDTKPLGPEWIYVRNPDFSKYENLKSCLRLHGISATLDSDKQSPTLVCRRQRDIKCDVTTALTMNSSSSGDEAGLSVFLDAGKHYDIFLRQDAKGRKIVVRYRLDYLTHIEREVSVPSSKKVYLRVSCEPETYSFCYSLDGNSFQNIGTMGTRFLSEECQGGFTGCVFGLYCTSPKEKATADFEFFDYDKR